MLLVNQLTGSTLALAAVAIALAIPPLTIGLVAGTYVDRWDRRRIMLVSDSLRAVVVLGFVVIEPRPSCMPLLVVLAFVQASIGTFFSPARGALVPRVVPAEGLLAANAITQATRVIAGVVGRAARRPHRRRRRRSPGRRSSSTRATFAASRCSSSTA